MVSEKIFLIGQSQTRTVYSVHGNFVQPNRFQRNRTTWNLWKVFYHGEVLRNLPRGRGGHDRMVVGFTTTYMQSKSITTDVVSSNLDQGEVYNIW